MSLIAECSGGGKKEGAGNHGCDEGEAEEEKRVTGEVTAVCCCDGILTGGWAEGFSLEDWHYSDEDGGAMVE